MGDNPDVSLKWNNHTLSFGQLLKDLCFSEVYSDATLVCQEAYFPVHKMVLANCSSYFKSLFERIPCDRPFIILKDINPREMESLLTFIYHGEVDAFQDDLPALLDGAEYLQIEGLTVHDRNVSNTLTPNKKGKRKSSSSSPTKKKQAKTDFDTVEFEHLEPDTILQSGNSTLIVDSEEKEVDDQSNPSLREDSALTSYKEGGELCCPDCGYTSRKSFNLARHIMRNHTGEKPHACHLCSYRAVETTQLTNHIERNHSGNKPFICPHCSFGTITLRKLKMHMKLHEGGKVPDKGQLKIKLPPGNVQSLELNAIDNDPVYSNERINEQKNNESNLSPRENTLSIENQHQELPIFTLSLPPDFPIIKSENNPNISDSCPS